MLTQDALGSLLTWAQPALQTWFTLWGSPVTPLEVVAFVLSLWMVVCNLQVKPLAWPLAMLASACYGVLFLSFRLYGEAGLQGLFIVLAAWGWWQWLKGRGADGEALSVTALSVRGRWLALLAWLLMWPVLAGVLMRHTDTDVPWWDAFPTAGSVLGQVLLGRQHLENWVVWGVVNAVSVGLFAWKGLWLTAVLYALFMVLSAWGWWAWRERLRAQRVSP